MPDPVGMPAFRPQTSPTLSDTALRKAAVALEATFLSRMLKESGLGQTSDSFGGGAGEDQFSSFLTDEHARLMAESGGIGLAQSIFESLKRGSHE